MARPLALLSASAATPNGQGKERGKERCVVVVEGGRPGEAGAGDEQANHRVALERRPSRRFGRPPCREEREAHQRHDRDYHDALEGVGQQPTVRGRGHADELGNARPMIGHRPGAAFELGQHDLADEGDGRDHEKGAANNAKRRGGAEHQSGRVLQVLRGRERPLVDPELADEDH